MVRRALAAIACFAIGGLVLPFALFPLWWLATRNHTVIGLEGVQVIIRVIFPGARGVFLGLTGPRMTDHLIVIKWFKALAENIVLHTLAGTIIVLTIRIAKSRLIGSRFNK